MMRLNEVWQTDPAAGEWRGVTCDCVRLCGGGRKGSKGWRASSCAIPVIECRNGRDTWHVAVWLTRADVPPLGVTSYCNLIIWTLIICHPSSDQLCLHHFCTDSGKTEFWGIMAMLPACLLVTVTETPWHTPVMLMSDSPSIVGPSPDLAWSPGQQHIHWPLTPSVHTLQLVFAFYKFMAFFLGLLVLKTTNFPPFQNIALWIFE